MEDADIFKLIIILAVLLLIGIKVVLVTRYYNRKLEYKKRVVDEQIARSASQIGSTTSSATIMPSLPFPSAGGTP
jgi:hypothetical protein